MIPRQNRPSTALLTIGVLSASGLIEACAGGQTGGEVDAPLCDEQVQLVEWNATTPLGFAAADVAETLDRQDVVSPVWLPPAHPERATYVTPEAGTPLTLTQTPITGQVAFVRSQPHAGTPGMETLAWATTSCRDRLEVPVRLTLRSAAGELDHTLQTQVWVFGRDEAKAQFRIAAEDLSGTLQVETAENVTAELLLRIEWTAAGDSPEGGIDLGTERVSSQTADYMSVPFATW